MDQAQQQQVADSIVHLHSARPVDGGAKPLFSDVLCLSHLRWDHVFQRPQQLMRRFTKKRRVFYVEEPEYELGGSPGFRLQRTAEAVWRVVPYLPAGLGDGDRARLIRESLDQMIAEWAMDRYLLWYYTPMALEFSSHLQPVGVVYDCIDDLSGFADAPADMAQNEHRLLQRADLVFTGGRSLYEARRPLHPNVHLFPSSVDTAHFAGIRDATPMSWDDTWKEMERTIAQALGDGATGDSNTEAQSWAALSRAQ